MTKLVTPFRPFPPESTHHHDLGKFDWIQAITMLRHSVEQSNQLPVHIITDVDQKGQLPEPAYFYETCHRRLMLWILEIALRYVESDDFDEDTIMISPDFLVFGRVDRWWGDFDIGLLHRAGEKYDSPRLRILNSVQFWRVAGKKALIEFYRRVLTHGEKLGEPLLKWGADTVALDIEAIPLTGRVVERNGCRICLIPCHTVTQHINAKSLRRLSFDYWPDRFVDFKNKKKRQMKEIFDIIFAPRREIVVTKSRWRVPRSDRFMAKHIDAASGAYQGSHLSLAMCFVRNFRTAVDGGAHVGTWAVPMARKFWKVHAFEPSPDTFIALRQNLASFGVKNVVAYPNALGHYSGNVHMELDVRAQEMENMGARFCMHGGEIQVRPLDSLHINSLDLLKLDVEGYEVDALKGAMRTLRHCKPVVIFEDKGHWKRYGHDREEPQRILTNLGARHLARVEMDEIWGWK